MKIGPALLNRIHSLLPPRKTILELGSGEGTGLLAQRYRMFSVEHDPSWLHRYNSMYIHAPIVNGWYDVDRLTIHLPRCYHLFLVDGPQGNIGRGGLLDHLDLFQWNVPIIVDDVHRKTEHYILTQLELHTKRKASIEMDGIKLFGVIA